MTGNGWLQIVAFLVGVLAVTPLLGRFMTRVFNREPTWLDAVLRPVERTIYRATGVDESREMRWTEYAAAALIFSAVGMTVLYALQRLQQVLPVNPQGVGAVPPALAFNTAAAFATNTDWQAYSGESTMSYLTQMAGLGYQNFVSAATGIALAIAFIRGIAQREKDSLGNFWVDLVRASLWVLLPLCIAGALFLVWQGSIQNLQPHAVVATLQGAPQTIAQGPVASQEIIKELGTNGGGFFNANSAHPFENPTPLSNFFEMLCIFAISAGLTFTLGDMTGSRRHGWAMWGAMAFLFIAGVTLAYAAEARGNPLFAAAPGGNMEGKETRFGIVNTVLFAVVTTAASCGATNGAHDSFTPLGGLVLLVNIMLGEVIFGGAGAGMYGMLLFVILSVFIAGLMVGRTPEYLGKKVDAYAVQMTMLVILVFPATVLLLSGIALVSPSFGTSSIANRGPHGLTEILYAYTSAAGNNGSAFGGLRADTNWYNLTLGLAMLVGRFFTIVPMLAVAGHLGRQNAIPPSPGTFPVTTALFSALLVSVILIVGALTFFPALSLGPIVEHLLMLKGQVF